MSIGISKKIQFLNFATQAIEDIYIDEKIITPFSVTATINNSVANFELELFTKTHNIQSGQLVKYYIYTPLYKDGKLVYFGYVDEIKEKRERSKDKATDTIIVSILPIKNLLDKVYYSTGTKIYIPNSEEDTLSVSDQANLVYESFDSLYPNILTKGVLFGDTQVRLFMGRVNHNQALNKITEVQGYSRHITYDGVLYFMQKYNTEQNGSDIEYRLLENGEIRLLENGEERVIERVNTIPSGPTQFGYSVRTLREGVDIVSIESTGQSAYDSVNKVYVDWTEEFIQILETKDVFDESIGSNVKAGDIQSFSNQYVNLGSVIVKRDDIVLTQGVSYQLFFGGDDGQQLLIRFLLDQAGSVTADYTYTPRTITEIVRTEVVQDNDDISVNGLREFVLDLRSDLIGSEFVGLVAIDRGNRYLENNKFVVGSIELEVTNSYHYFDIKPGDLLLINNTEKIYSNLVVSQITYNINSATIICNKVENLSTSLQ